MKMHRVSAFAFAVAVLATLAACDTSIAPTVAQIGGSTSSVNGRSPLIMSPGSFTLAAGSTFQFTSNAPIALQGLLQWNSLDQTVATVSPSGTVLGASAGTTTITVRYADDTTNVASATVTVVGVPATGNRIP
jgi:hypothetical protein